MSAICEWRIANNLCGKTKHCCTEILKTSCNITAQDIESMELSEREQTENDLPPWE